MPNSLLQALCESPKIPASQLPFNAADLALKLTQLRELGVNVQETKGELTLVPTLPLLDLQRLRAALPYQLFYEKLIDSTNTFIETHRANLKKGDLCLTEFQTAGRGRRGNRWIAPFAGQLIFSFYWQVAHTEPLQGLSLAIGLALAETFGAQVKWPNDVLYQGRKLAGISVDIIGSAQEQKALVIGVGINAKLPENLAIDRPVASLSEFIPQLDRSQAIIDAVQAIYTALEHFAQHGIDANFRQRWQQYNAYAGRAVNVLKGQETLHGIENGIDDNGHLSVLIAGVPQSFSAAEVSLRAQ